MFGQARTATTQTTSRSSWVRPQTDFIATRREPADYPIRMDVEVQEFIENATRARWIGRCNGMSLAPSASLALEIGRCLPNISAVRKIRAVL